MTFRKHQVKLVSKFPLGLRATNRAKTYWLFVDRIPYRLTSFIPYEL